MQKQSETLTLEDVDLDITVRPGAAEPDGEPAEG